MIKYIEKNYFCIYRLMIKAYKYRLYPTVQQKILLNKHFGCARLVYNLALETKQMAYVGNMKYLSCIDLINQLPALKKDFVWLKEINAQSLQMTIRNLDNAYTRFFKGQGDFPKHKSKKDRQSYQLPQEVRIDFENNKIKLPKFKKTIKIVIDRQFEGNIKTCTVSKTKTNKYFISILVEDNMLIPATMNICDETSVGIDLGIKTFVVCSDGTKYDNPKYLKNSIRHIKYMNKMFSKKKLKSNRRDNYRIKLAKQYEKITNKRKDFLHKLSDEITNRHSTICVETLRVKNMMSNHKLAQSIGDAGWSMFVRFTSYKCERKGKNFLQIGTFEPSSKTCSCCGYINKYLKLEDREWTCPECNTHHDRDQNASNNIKVFALKKWRLEQPLKKDVELPTLVGAMKRQGQ